MDRFRIYVEGGYNGRETYAQAISYAHCALINKWQDSGDILACWALIRDTQKGVDTLVFLTLDMKIKFKKFCR